MSASDIRVLRWDSDISPEEKGIVDFRLTYEGRLPAFPTSRDKQLQRSHTIHDIRQRFHLQLKSLWDAHPVLLDAVGGGP